MALETRKISDINTLIINQLEAQIGKTVPILPKSFIRILAKVLSGTWIINYQAANWMFLQWFVSTACYCDITVLGKTINPLIEWGRLVGAGDPIPATQAQLEIDLVVNSIGETLYAGTQFISTLNNVIYITEENYTLSANPTTVQVTAVTAGIIGNIEVADVLTTVTTLGIIDNDAPVSSIVTTAIDQESETDYRKKVKERFSQQPQGGALADYRNWAADVAGVWQTYPYSGDTPNDVLIFVAGDPDIYPDRIANSALLLAVGDAIDYDPITGDADRRPMGAIVDPDGDGSYTNITSITPVEFDVTITGASSIAYNSEIKTDLEEYMLEREAYIQGLSRLPKKDKITQSNIIGIVNSILNSNSETFLNAVIYESSVQTSSYTLNQGELAKLGTLTINGVVV